MTARTHRHIFIGAGASGTARPAPASRRAGVVVDHAVAALPDKPPEMSQRDYLIMLVHIAAGLEHALMVEYLYAAYSLGGPGSAKHARQVREWHDAILTVAREEMGHLLTVQNLLLFIGGVVSFEREDYPWSSPFYPFRFRLERLTLESLACFVYAEMPKTLERPADIEVVRQVKRIMKPQGPTPTVGEIYSRIIDLIADTRKIPESTLNPDSYNYQATWDEWGRGYQPGTHKPYAKDPDVPPPYERKTRVIVRRMATRTEALAALRDIASQGEAEHLRSSEKMEDSHFDRFARIFRSYQAILKKEPAWTPSHLVPVNPFAGEAKYAPDDTTPITAEESLIWASLFNVRHRMLLTLLTYTFGIARDTPETSDLRRGPVLARIFGEMYNLKAIAGVLVRMPLGDPLRAERAGPPFQMPYTLTPPLPEANFWRMQIDLLSASGELVDELLGRKGRSHTPMDGTRYLRALREADARHDAWIGRVLEGMTTSRRRRA